MKKYVRWLSLIVIIFCVCIFGVFHIRSEEAKNAGKPPATMPKVAPTFVENQGQYDPTVKFYLTAPGKNIFLTDTGIVMDF